MPAAREIGQRFEGAWQFLTLLPVRRYRAPFEEAAVFFPVVGGMLGLLLGFTYWLLLQLSVPGGLAAALALSVQLAITGLYREAGLASVTDAAYSGSPPALMLEAMREARLGAFGAASLVLVLLIRWQALTVLAEAPAAFLLAAGCAAGMLSRGAVIFLAAASNPLGSGISSGLVGKVPGWLLLATGLQLSVAGSLLGWKGTAPLLLGGAMLVAVLRHWFATRMNGVHGHGLSTCSVLMECLVLSVAAWRGSF